MLPPRYQRRLQQFIKSYCDSPRALLFVVIGICTFFFLIAYIRAPSRDPLNWNELAQQLVAGNAGTQMFPGQVAGTIVDRETLAILSGKPLEKEELRRFLIDVFDLEKDRAILDKTEYLIVERTEEYTFGAASRFRNVIVQITDKIILIGQYNPIFRDDGRAAIEHVTYVVRDAGY